MRILTALHRLAETGEGDVKLYFAATTAATKLATLGVPSPVRHFHQGHHGKRSVLFSKSRLHPLKDGLHAFPAALPRNEHAGIEDYSHEEISRGLRLLMMSSRSEAKSGSSVGS